MPALQSATARGADRIPSKSLGEILKAKLVVVKKLPCIHNQTGGAAFTVRGTASGPYRGTLTGSGSWNFTQVGTNLWTFSEAFKIVGAHSGNGTITGNGKGNLSKCKTFGPATSLKDLVYHIGTASGAATTTLLKIGASIVERLH